MFHRHCMCLNHMQGWLPDETAHSVHGSGWLVQKRLGNVKPPVAMDYVWDSKSILTTFREDLSKYGVIFCSISEAVKEYPEIGRAHV